jgi:hypothetical protein
MQEQEFTNSSHDRSVNPAIHSSIYSKSSFEPYCGYL